MRDLRRGIAARIALAALAAAGLAIAIVAIGVILVGGQAFTDLMVLHGNSTQESREMFDRSVTTWVLAGTLIAAIASIALAVLMARMLTRPLAEVGRAARRVADGDYQARVPRDGPEEIADLADSFNQMAMSLQEQETMRRDFIASAAHELRTPLTNLQGYLEALRDGVLQGDRATYESLWDEADRLVRLARSLDALAEGDRAGRAPSSVELDLAPILDAAVKLARPGLEARQLSVERHWPASLRVRADADHLAQVLANLLQNATRYTDEGGHVVVAAEMRPESVLVSVTNSGDPIPETDLPHVFDRFYRVEKSRDRARGGAGIGLAIVKQLVEAGGGRVGAESATGRTRFWFSIPTIGGGASPA